ncbi:MAG: cupin domain-containing protein [Syntrophomonas sp.]
MSCKNIYHKSAEGYLAVADGIARKTLVFEEKTLLCEFILQKGKKLPLHQHPEEQTGYLVSGHIILQVADDHYDMHAGDSWAIPGNVEHAADILEDSVAIEVFSPVRQDYVSCDS